MKKTLTLLKSRYNLIMLNYPMLTVRNTPNQARSPVSAFRIMLMHITKLVSMNTFLLLVCINFSFLTGCSTRAPISIILAEYSSTHGGAETPVGGYFSWQIDILLKVNSPNIYIDSLSIGQEVYTVSKQKLLSPDTCKLTFGQSGYTQELAQTVEGRICSGNLSLTRLGYITYKPNRPKIEVYYSQNGTSYLASKHEFDRFDEYVAD